MNKKIIDIENQLHEREKELDALYKLSILFTDPELSSEEIIKKTKYVLKESMQFHEYADVQICLSDSSYTFENNIEKIQETAANETCSASAVFSINKLITITISYEKHKSKSSVKLEFLDRERHLVQSTVSLLANVLQKNDLESILRQSTVRLQQQADDLENKNIALQEILSLYDQDRKKYQEEINTFFDFIIYPEMHKLLMDKMIIGQSRDIILNIKTSLEKKFEKKSDALLKIRDLLTPRELQICSLIKNGMSTKDISLHLNISELTVERHRNTIRKKLKINNSSINLTTYLRS